MFKRLLWKSFCFGIVSSMKVYRTDNALVIEFGLLQRLFVFCKRVVIPKENIGQIYWDKHYIGPIGINVLTNHMLGIHTVFLVSGVLKIHGIKEFWYVKHQESLIGYAFPNVLSIDTINSYTVAHVRISLDEASAQELINWSQAFTGANRSATNDAVATNTF
jgi:hypothetical protein